MDGTPQQVDLIDDIWRQIFTRLDCRRSARLFQVCKRWQSILSNTVSWLELDVKFLNESTTESDLVSFKKFVSKYCYQATKVNIEVANIPTWVPLFQAVLPLAQLRYLRFTVGNVRNNASQVQWETPKWSNLVYLNLGCASNVLLENKVFERILQAAPNLEELYLHRYFFMTAEPGWTSIFKPLQKLKSLSINEQGITSSFGGALFGDGPRQPTVQPEMVTEQLPNLQVLYLYRPDRNEEGNNGGGGGFGFGFGQAQPAAPICQQRGNTFVVSTDLLKSRDLEMVKRIGPLLKKTNYALYFAPKKQQPDFDPELLDYLFKDLKLDINCNTIDMRLYRPFTSELFLEPLGFATHACPLSCGIESVDTVRKLLDLGADPNMPHEAMSPFSMLTVTKEVCLLLLERGADPLKKVRGQAAISLMFGSKNIKDDEMSEIMTVILQKGVDVNSVLSDNGATFLDLAMQYEFEKTARALVAHGAKLTANSMDQLITWNDEWWRDLIESGAFDVNKLHLSTVLRAVKFDLFPLMRDYLQNIAQGLDVNGYNLAHYASVLALLSISPKKKDDGKAKALSLGDGAAAFTVAPGWGGGPMFQSSDPPLIIQAQPLFGQPQPMFASDDTQSSPPKKASDGATVFNVAPMFQSSDPPMIGQPQPLFADTQSSPPKKSSDGSAVFNIAPGSNLFGGGPMFQPAEPPMSANTTNADSQTPSSAPKADGAAVFNVAPGWPGGAMFQSADTPMIANTDTQPKTDTSNTNAPSFGDGAAVFTVTPGTSLFGGATLQFGGESTSFGQPSPMFTSPDSQPPSMLANTNIQPSSSAPKGDGAAVFTITPGTTIFGATLQFAAEQSTTFGPLFSNANTQTPPSAPKGDGAALFNVAPGWPSGPMFQPADLPTLGQPYPMFANAGPFPTSDLKPFPMSGAPFSSNEKMTPMEVESVSPNASLLIRLVKELNLDVNVKSATGQTPLLLVCSHSTDDESVVTALIECGARVNEPDSNGWTPLHAALYLHKYDTVKVLLSHGANMNAQDKLGVTPVTGFISSLLWPKEADVTMWKYLLSLGIDVNITDKYMSRNVLHYVCSRHTELLTALLEKIPNININCPDAHGFTPLHYAAIGLEEEMMKMLVEHGADTNAVTHILRLTPVSAMIAAGTPVSPYYRYLKSYNSMSGTAPVILTTSIGPEEHPLEIISITVPSWLSDGERERTRLRKEKKLGEYFPLPTDLSIKDQFGNTILHGIARSTDYLRTFLNNNHLFSPAINELWSTPNNFGTTPFHIFAKHTFYTEMYPVSIAEETLLKLLEQPNIVDSLNSQDEHGRTGLEYLMEHKRSRASLSTDIKPVLLQMKGLKFISSRVESISSLPHIAIESNRLDSSMLGKIAESDPESLNLKVDGKTPLMLFMEKLFVNNDVNDVPVNVAWVKIIDTFLQLKVDLNAQDNQGNTALHHACFFLHLGGWNCPLMHDSHLFSLIAFKLLDAGARVDIANKSGQTVLDIVPNLLELDRSLVHQVKVPVVKTPTDGLSKLRLHLKSAKQF